MSRPTDVNVVRCMWLFRLKHFANGTLSRYKSCLVANGITQLSGMVVDETCSPVFKLATIRTLYHSLVGALQYLYLYLQEYFLCDHGLQLYSSSTTYLVAYSDVDWAGFPTTRRSTSGYCVFLGNNLLSWSFKCQQTLSQSSVEVEYHGVTNAVAETCWLRNLLRELHTPLPSATLVYCDNISAVYLSSNPVKHQRTKHIEIDIHFVRDLVVVF
ncbi:ribonuclease H-like domain-containing protein [Tanacetum coccineum]